MDTPRSARRKSKICYKEDDSFVEEFQYRAKEPQTKSKTRKSLAKNVKKIEDSESSDTESELTNKENIKKDSAMKLVDVRETKSWNPVVVLNPTETNIVSNEPSTPYTPVRRGTRTRHKTAIAVEAEESCKLMKKLSVKNVADKVESEEEGDEALHAIEKPSALFCDGDVEGKDMFKFKMLHKRESMIKKAIESVLESPKIKTNDNLSKGNLTPKTPRSSQKNKISTPLSKNRKSLFNTPKSGKSHMAVEKTPHHIRSKMKKKLETLDMEDSPSDFEDSGSDFQPSEDESVSESDHSVDSEKEKSESSESEEEKQVKPKTKPISANTKPYSLRNSKLDKEEQFIMKADNYFTMQSGKKIVTSNHTLERLKTPRLTEDKLQAILNQQKLSAEHCNAIEELMEDYERLFDKWMYILSEGFSILLHGVGSKYKLIQDFQLKKLSNYPCLVINGFFPSLTLKDILELIAVDLLELNSVPANVFDVVTLIDEELGNIPEQHVFLLIHNIDGAMLKNNKTQTVLSKLAKIKNIHIVASVDHINAPLIWDHSIMRNFNFSWWDVTTLLPYTKETAFESSLMVHKSGVLVLSSLNNVFQSLTTNAKGIFMVIVKNQLKNKKTPHYQGISFKDLYWSSREAFLVSSDLALRAQLTEFLDHKLVKAKRTADGVENLTIPMDNTLLQQFLDENES